MDFFGHWGEISIAPDLSGVYDIPNQENTEEPVEQEKDETSHAGNSNNKEVEM